MGLSNKKKFSILGLFWNKEQKFINPIGLFVLSWVISIVYGIYLMGKYDSYYASEKTMHIGLIGTVLCVVGYGVIELKKALKKKKDK